MKKFTFFKTLLMAAGLCMGSVSAWADSETTTNYDFEDGSTLFTAYNSGKVTIANTTPEGYSSKAVKFVWRQKGDNYLAYYDFSSLVSNASKVTVEFDFYVTSGAGHSLISLADANFHTGSLGGFGNGNTSYGSNGAIFNLGCYRYNGSNKFAINSSQNSLEGLGAWCHAKVVVDNAGKTVSYIITKDGATLASADGISFMNVNAVKCTQIDVYTAIQDSNTPIYLDNLSITSTVISANHSYAINAVADGQIIKSLVSKMCAEGENYSTYLPEVILYNGSYYELNDANLTNYLASFEMGSEDVVKEIAYTKNGNIVYYGDWETAYTTSSTNYKIANDQNGLSQGQGRTIVKTDATMNLTFTVPLAGKYRIEIPYLNLNEKDRKHIIYLDGTEDVNKLEEKSVAKNGGSGIYSEEVELTAGSHTIYVKCSYSLTAAMDYLKVTLTEVPATIGATGYATFASTSPLDLSNLPEGLTAYCVSNVSGDYATLSTANTAVPAGEGLLLKGTANETYSIPVAAAGTALSGNKLVGVTEATTVAAGNYVFGAINDGAGNYDEIGFHVVADGGYNLAAGKAYLNAQGSSAKLRFFFGDDASGIKTIAADAAENGAIYNVAGQRVNAAYKGIIIKNGKKYINK